MITVGNLNEVLRASIPKEVPEIQLRWMDGATLYYLLQDVPKSLRSMIGLWSRRGKVRKPGPTNRWQP